jgi:hypothetical protein
MLVSAHHKAPCRKTETWVLTHEEEPLLEGARLKQRKQETPTTDRKKQGLIQVRQVNVARGRRVRHI